MKKILIFISILALKTIAFPDNYNAKETFILPWGWDNNQELPYSIENDGMAFGPYLRAADNKSNIYLAFPYKDFRKYNSIGKLIYRANIKVDQFAVDDSQNVYYTELDIDKMHIVRIIDKNGIELVNRYQFAINNQDQNISWMKNRNGQVVFGNYRETAKINNSTISSIDRQKKDPIDSKGRYYQSETAMRKSNIESKASYNQEFINIIINKVTGNEIVILDTIPLHICRYPQQGAEIVEIDKNDNFYLWIYYNLELPIDFVILDSTYKEIDRIELVPIAQSKGLWLRPYVLPNGTIYEFRDLEDGLHVIRWSRKE